MQPLGRSLVLTAFIMVMIGITGCQQKNPETVAPSTASDRMENPETNNLSGIWVSENGERWIEFLDNGKLDMEVKGKNLVTGVPYTLDMQAGTLSIQGKKENREFTFRMKEGALYIKPANADRELKYNKKAERPVY
jgi:hypothetical protein